MKDNATFDKKIIFLKAKKINITLKSIHWEIIFYFKYYYKKNNLLPNIIKVLSYLNKKRKKKIDSIILYKLFPGGFMSQITYICSLGNKSIVCF